VNHPVTPPITPMLARLTRELPREGYLYEPKWDGFRCLVFRDGADVDLRSRNRRPLARYFPELAQAVAKLPTEAFVLDGEIVVLDPAGVDFEALLRRLHPAASRVQRLSADTPASLIAFDLLAIGSEDLRAEPFHRRRERLAELVGPALPPLHLTPITDDVARAELWLERFQGGGTDGVVAKHRDLSYESGARAMIKVKHERTADCVVAGVRWLVDRPLPRSLLLGAYDEEGELRHVGVSTSFSEERRAQILAEVAPHVTSLEGHPWEQGFLLGGSSMGKLPGAAGRWTPEMSQDWTPLEPTLVCEVAYDHVDAYRLRHPARFRRWRPDLDPDDCTLDQLETPHAPIGELLVRP
jgi:ATP-dependent DNA ligase